MRPPPAHPLRRFLLVPLLLLAAACGRSSSPGSEDPSQAGPGRLEAVAQLNSIPVADIAQAVLAADSWTPTLTPLYEVANYRLSYLTTDAQGREIVASGLVSVPLKPAGAMSPLLAYQHGTTFKDAEAPSNHATASEPAVIFASLGYIVIAADYLGYGVSKGVPHPYLLSAPSASTVIDLLTAARTWRRSTGVADNGQLFLMGYSEGGYVTVAAHRAMQASDSPHLRSLLAAVPGAGPYHLGVTLDELLRRIREDNPLLGALIDPGLLSQLSPSLRQQVLEELLRRLLPGDADVVFDTTVLANYLADDRDALERQSNVHDWAPAAPVRLFHGPEDETVPYASATQTLAAMLARGAGDVSLTDCTAVPSSHIGCVPQYLAFALAEIAARARNL